MSFLTLALADIRQSAQAVVEQKMPVQSQMLQVQTGILSLAKVSTTGFHEGEVAALVDNRTSFSEQADNFTQQLNQLGQLIGAGNTTFEQGRQQALAYMEQSRLMYQARESQLRLDSSIGETATRILDMADEASALMMDLSYLEGDEPELDTLIGTGATIDNRLVPLLDSTKEIITVEDAEFSGTIRGDIEFAISNLDVDSDYLNRLAEQVQTDGIVDSFNQQYEGLKNEFTQPGGLFVQLQNKIAHVTAAETHMGLAEQALEQAITAFSQLFSQVNRSTLEGQNAILDSVQSNIWKSVAIMLVALAAVAVLGSLAARSIATPLARINRSLRIISSGDLAHQADTQGSREFSVLSENVNQLSGSLHNLVSQILKQESDLEGATRESARLGKETLHQVDTQRQQISQTASHTMAVRTTSQSNLTQIQMAMSQLDDVSQQSAVVSDLVRGSRAQIGQQAEQAQQSSDIIHRLEQNSHKIGSILDVIKTIAEQTNLLALNAAIEAARAGEQGRGFAVVADEVRTLANRTHGSTEEIEAMIGTLQRDAELAVKAISKGNEQAHESVAQIESVNEQVTQISGIIQKLSEINQQIVNDTHQQDSLLHEVDNNLNRIVELAEQTAQSTQKSNQSNLEVEQMTEKLNHLVRRFKL